MHSCLSVGPLLLDGRRGMVLAGQAVGLVSDLHLGKARSFRAAGLAIPEGSDAATLARLAEMVRAHGLQTLVVVGDLIHNRDSLSDALAEMWGAWRNTLQSEGHLRQVILLPGNHDRPAVGQRLETALDGIQVQEHWEALLPLRLEAAHEPSDLPPPPRPPGTLQVVGHTHPVAVMQGPGRDRLRLPCFVRQGHRWTLPAFGEFTGGHEVGPLQADARYAVGAGRIWPLPTPTPEHP